MDTVLDTFDPVTGKRSWIEGSTVAQFKVGDRVKDSVSGWAGKITLIGSSYYEGGLIQVEFENNQKFVFVHVSQLSLISAEEPDESKFSEGDRVYAKKDPDDTGTVISRSQTGFYEVDFDFGGICFMPEGELAYVNLGNEADLAAAVFKPSEDPRIKHFEELGKVAEQLGISSFEQSVRYHTNKIADLLISKNKAYGDSALNPVRIFSKADRMEQLYTRLDDKISRVKSGHEYPGDDTIQDIIGYCTLILIARESE